MINKSLKKVTASLLIPVLLMASVPAIAAETDSEDTYPETQEEYDLEPSISENSSSGIDFYHPTGYLPLDPDEKVPMPDRDISYSEILSEIVKKDGETDAADYSPRADLPARYPVPGGSDEDVKNFIESHYPLPKDQGNFGTCWAFSAVAAAEFYGINHLGFDRSVDFSEEYLAYGMYKNLKDPFMSDEDIAGRVYCEKNDMDRLASGSDPHIVAQHLSKNYGFINESDLPYIKNVNDERFDASGNLNVDMDALAGKHTAFMTNFYKVDMTGSTGVNIVKEAIMRNGCVGTMIYFDGNYYDSEHASYYSNTNNAINHSVAIVGWNDGFPKENFKNAASKNGAWLIRNSWYMPSEEFYHYANYFWLSYDDMNCITAYIFDIKKAPAGYDNVYHYDTRLHGISNLQYSSKTANVFRVQGKSNELLSSICLEIPRATDYEISIYTGLKDGNNPESGTLARGSVTRGTLNLRGIYNIPLNSPVLLEKGTDYAVVVKTTDCSVNFEYSINNYPSMHSSFDCGAKRGQSFILKNSAWTDWMDHEEFDDSSGNFCISAMTSYTDEEVPVTEEVVFKDTYGQNVTLLHNKEDNTYKTSDGKDVLVLSTETGESVPAPKYQFTGKKMYPAKKSFVVYKGTLYKYKTDYSIKYKKNKNSGSAVATVKWKKTSAPYKAGEKKAVMTFNIVPRTVTDSMVSYSLKNNKLKKLRVTADGITMKPKKIDYSYTVLGSGKCRITFRNNYSGVTGDGSR